ncbi:MAG: HlyD family type I secretion periplasmic adaptor subunit, partial [Pseudomonadota bacterium]
MAEPVDARDQVSALVKTSRVSLAGYAVIGLFFGGFGFWAATAPLEGAAIASGAVAVSSENLTISHFEGGVVERIHVRDGSRVKAGEPLITLESTAAMAEYQRLQKRRAALTAQLARLRAERDEDASITFDPDLIRSAEEIGLTDLLDEQIAQFNVRRERFAAEFEILSQRIAGLRETIAGLKAQQSSIAEQIAVLSEEATRREELLEKGLTVRSEYSEILRSRAALVGEAGRVESEIARSNIQILEAQENRVRLRTQIVEEVVAQVNDLRAQLEDIEEQANAARNVLDRTTIRAPSEAYVVNLGINTIGTAVRSGEPVAELLP